jgi:hypothetical protein
LTPCLQPWQSHRFLHGLFYRQISDCKTVDYDKFAFSSCDAWKGRNSGEGKYRNCFLLSAVLTIL